MSYADITFSDPNPIKRWLQRSRLRTALALGAHCVSATERVCDYGAGNGELCSLILKNSPELEVLCFEPSATLMEEAKNLLGVREKLQFFLESKQIEARSVDVLFCLEVFEHLPEEEMHFALKEIGRIVRPNGRVVIGVPVEIGVPAGYKGLFRMIRRRGNFDATFKNIWNSVVGSPPVERPVAEIAPGLLFHFDHMGFDYRKFSKVLEQNFDIVVKTYSPFKHFGFFMPEIYFVLTPKSIHPAA